MSPGAPTGRWWRVGVWAAYWAMMFVGTHLPPSSRAVRFAAILPDWFLHSTMFAGLGWLVVWAPRPRLTVPAGGRGPLIFRTVAWYLALLAYAAADEMTQPLVGRQCELKDWMADAIGAAIGMGAAMIWRAGRASGRPESVA